MATKNPNDKHAFLFSGPTGDRQLRDLENVVETLVEYYNYPTGSITIVLGSTPAVMPGFSGVTPTTIANLTALETEMATFALSANTAAKTVLLYFTGWGVQESGESKLFIDDNLTSPTKVGPAWLIPRLNAFVAAQVNVVMQQGYAGGFDAALTDPAMTLTGWTFTYASAGSEDNYGDPSPSIMGSYFTHAWTRGLKLDVMPAGFPHGGQYADELGLGTEATNRLISMEEAMVFGKEVHDNDTAYMAGTGLTATPGYTGPAGGPQQYLGLPDLVVRDGTPWYESPDIYLTHPLDPTLDPGNEDLYVPDPVTATSPPYNNRVNVALRNMGTHPVRAYSIALELFWMGGGGPGSDQHHAYDIAPTGGILFPMLPADIGTGSDKKHISLWDIPFYETSTHRCVKVNAGLLSSLVDYTWTVQAADDEAQRNIDILPLAPTAAPGTPPLPTKNIKGIKEHIYNIKNTFNEPRDFFLVFPEDYFKYREMIDMEWFQVPEGPQAERAPLDILEEPVPHIPFLIKEKEEKKILLSVRLKPGYEPEEEIRLPFEIIVKGEWDDNVENVRAAAAAAAEQLPAFAAFAGFTVVIRKGAATLKGTVLNRDGQLAADARVLLRTVNDLQGAVITTDKKGAFVFENINADVYHIQAESEDWHSKEQTVVLLGGKVAELNLPMTETAPTTGQRVKVIVEKIRIMNDKDPCIKGKGELTFTSVVEPDNDHSRKQVTRLPASGVYHVSDKPGKNEITPGVTIFKGVVKNRSLSITISGKEIDFFDPDDKLKRYHRVFSGDPATWYGEYFPTDEYLDREDVGDWAIWYRVTRG